MERLGLAAVVRDGAGKSVARRLRRGGKVPAVVYGHGVEVRPLSVESKALKDALHTHAGLNVLIDLGVEANGATDSHLVRVKDLQRNIFSHEIIHVDFQAISLEETLEAHVPLVLQGTPKGVIEGGVLEQHVREVVVECLPTQIPESIEVDVSGLVIGNVIHVGDLTIPEGVTLLTAVEEVVAAVHAPRVEVEEAPPAAAAEGEVPEAAPAEGEPPAGKEKAEEEGE